MGVISLGMRLDLPPQLLVLVVAALLTSSQLAHGGSPALLVDLSFQVEFLIGETLIPRLQGTPSAVSWSAVPGSLPERQEM